MKNIPAIPQADEHHNVLARFRESTSSKWSMVAWLGLGTIAVALIALTAGLVWRSERQIVNLQHAHAVGRNLQIVLADLEVAEARERELLLSGKTSYLESYDSSRKALDEEFDRLRELVRNNPAEQKEVEKLHYLVYQKLDDLQAVIDIRTKAGLEAARATILTRRGEQLMDLVRQDINTMEKEEQITLAGLLSEWRLRLRTSLATLVGSALVVGCCLLIGWIVLARQRHQAQEQLAASDIRFYALCEQAPLGIYETDAEGQCVYTNRQWSDISGLSARESLGIGWKSVLHPGDQRFEGWKTGARQGIAWEYRLVNGRGETRWIRAVHGPIHSAQGQVTGYVGTLEDVTERKQSEAKLLESEERFRNMADTAPVLIWVSGPDKGCIFFNKVWLDFTGRTMEQELGDGWTKGVHPEDLDRCLATYVASFDARRHFRMEYRLRRSDGEYRWLLDNGVPRFSAGDVFAGYIGSCIDITEKRRAEEERQKFVSLADRSLEFVGMCDLDFKPVYINKAGMDLVGLDNPEAAYGIRVPDFYFPEDQLFITNDFLPRVLREGHGKVEIRFRHFKTGEGIWMLLNVFSIFDARGTPVGWATASVNITERKRAETALQESRQELRALAGRLLLAQEEERRRISRELHDDLSQKVALLAFDTSSLVVAPPASPEELKQCLGNLHSSIERLSKDIRQVSHRLHPSILEDLGLVAALSELCEEFSARTTIHAVFEQTEIPDDLPVDVAACLYRLAQEALHNVQKHARANQVRMALNGTPGSLRLCIQDDGIGFSAHSSDRSLGMVSMQERVRLVQGELSIRSQPGKGTMVTVCVPLPRRTNEAHASTTSG